MAPRPAKSGRPPKGSPTLTRDAVLTAALPMAQEGGIDAISFRALADRLGVTAMAVSYHSGNKRQLIADLVDLAFRGAVGDPAAEGPAQHARAVLARYFPRALQNANLLHAVLADASLMSAELRRITDMLRADTQALGDEDDVLLHLLVDYTHGFVFSASSGEGTQPTIGEYLRGVDWILSRAAPA